MMINKKRKVSGFTLIEVLVSMFVFGYGVMSVISFMEASYVRTFKVNKMTAAARAFDYIENYLNILPPTSSVISQGNRFLQWDSIGLSTIERNKLYEQLGRPKYPPYLFILDYSPSAGKNYKIIRIYIFDNQSNSWFTIPYETFSREA